jgi:[ribosomal protein S18]-alanine N-acetyltransferase
MLAADVEWVARCESEICKFPWSLRNFSDSLGVGYSSWLLTRNDEYIGYAIMLLVADEAHLLNIGIAAARQGQGQGGRLLNRLLGLAQEKGATQMFLEVRPSNEPALALYRKTGFVEIGRRKGYYPAPDGREDALVLRCPL